MNICVLMGRLTRDPETRFSAQGQGVGRFSIAVDRRFKREGQPDADFFDCVCFGRQAEFMDKYLRKGTKVVINGSIQNRLSGTAVSAGSTGSGTDTGSGPCLCTGYLRRRFHEYTGWHRRRASVQLIGGA